MLTILKNESLGLKIGVFLQLGITPPKHPHLSLPDQSTFLNCFLLVMCYPALSFLFFTLSTLSWSVFASVQITWQASVISGVSVLCPGTTNQILLLEIVPGGKRRLLHDSGGLGASLFGFGFFHRDIWLSEVKKCIYSGAFQFQDLIVSGLMVDTTVALQVGLGLPQGRPRDEISECIILPQRATLCNNQKRF